MERREPPDSSEYNRDRDRVFDPDRVFGRALSSGGKKEDMSNLGLWISGGRRKTEVWLNIASRWEVSGR